MSHAHSAGQSRGGGDNNFSTAQGMGGIMAPSPFMIVGDGELVQEIKNSKGDAVQLTNASPQILYGLRLLLHSGPGHNSSEISSRCAPGMAALPKGPKCATLTDAK